MKASFKDQLKTVSADQNIEELLDIFLDNSKSFPTIEEMNVMVDEHFHQWVEKNKTSSKVYSRKSKLRIEKHLFNIHLKDRKTHIIFKAKVLKKTLGIQWVSLHYVSTPKGLLYFHLIPRNKTVICYYSHFFDRYATRALDENFKNRTNSINGYFLDLLGNDFIQIYNTNNKEIKICVEEGLVLGSFNMMKRGNEIGRFIVCNTFISKEMLRVDQLSMWKDARAKKLKLEEPYFIIY